MQMFKDLTVQELHDLLDAIDRAYCSLEDYLIYCDPEEENDLTDQLNRFNKLQEKIETALKWK